MTPTEILLLIGAVWVALGGCIYLAAGRTGHDPFVWLLITFALGPLTLFLVADAWRHPDKREMALQRGSQLPGASGLHVVVGIDGSDESGDAVVDALALAVGRLASLSLVAVIPSDAAADAVHQADARLHRASLLVEPLIPALAIVRGEPGRALEEYAVAHHADLLVVGRRGSGHAHPFGSTARRLAGSSGVPVLIARSRADLTQPATDAAPTATAEVTR